MHLIIGKRRSRSKLPRKVAPSRNRIYIVPVKKWKPNLKGEHQKIFASLRKRKWVSPTIIFQMQTIFFNIKSILWTLKTFTHRGLHHQRSLRAQAPYVLEHVNRAFESHPIQGDTDGAQRSGTATPITCGEKNNWLNLHPTSRRKTRNHFEFIIHHLSLYLIPIDQQMNC